MLVADVVVLGSLASITSSVGRVLYPTPHPHKYCRHLKPSKDLQIEPKTPSKEPVVWLVGL